jgi:hypothetical protein
MQPWKMFIRSASVVTVLTAGGFAAGQAVVPFVNASRGTSPAVEEPAPDAETPVVDPADEAPETDDSTTTTPEAPAVDDAPSTDEPANDPVVDPAPDAEVPEESTTTTTVTPIDVTAAPPAAPAPKAPKAKKAKSEKVKGDHNCDGHADNGWHNRPDLYPNYPAPNSNCPTTGRPAPAPASAPAPAPAPAAEDKGRSESAPGHTKSDDRPSNGRPATAPGQMKKSV